MSDQVVLVNPVDPSNKYTQMQKTYYDGQGSSGNMNRDNHKQHNNNPNYWNILISDTIAPEYKEKVGLDFGCGCGRNVMNLVNRFKKMEGVDISPELIKQCIINMANMNYDNSKFGFYTCNGTSLDIFEDNRYDFIMSTIVLQHICVYSIRFAYLSDFFRIMKNGGLLSFQMGFGSEHKNPTRDYYEDYYDAENTNSGCDVRVTDPKQIVGDLEKIGFVDITFEITPPFSDYHENWIFVKARKPSV
jgi:ubiquinone/menaquinone biosynthesis C-methylase UbiE